MMTPLPPNLSVEALETYITRYVGTGLWSSVGCNEKDQEYHVLPKEVCDRLIEMAKDAELLDWLETGSGPVNPVDWNIGRITRKSIRAAMKGTK